MRRFALWDAVLGLLHVPKGPILFKEFYFGQPKKEVVTITGAEQTEDDAFDALSLEEVSFAGKKWIQKFFFEEEKLDRIVFAGNDDIPGRFEKGLGAVVEDGFLLGKIQADKKFIEVVNETNELDGAEVVKKLIDFEIEALNSAQYVAYLLLEKKHIVKGTQVFSSFEDVIKKSSNKLRLVIIEEDATHEATYIRLSFSLPKLTQKEKF